MLFEKSLFEARTSDADAAQDAPAPSALPSTRLFTSQATLSPPPSASLPEASKSTKIPVFCTYFDKGHCNSGDSCRFAHGHKDLAAIAATVSAARGDTIKTKMCRFYKKGCCLSGTECLFAHSPKEMQAAAKAELDEVEHGSDTGLDTDTCSTSSEVMKADSKNVSSDSSEEDNSSIAMSLSQEGAQVEEEDEEEHGKLQEELGDMSLTCVKVHRYDHEGGQWVVDFLDLTEELPPTGHQFPSQEEAPVSKAADVHKTSINLEAVFPPKASSRQGRWSSAQTAAPPLYQRTPLRPSAASFKPPLHRLTALKTSAAMFVPMAAMLN